MCPAAARTDQVEMLESRGMVVLPGVNVVEVEHEIEPGR